MRLTVSEVEKMDDLAFKAPKNDLTKESSIMEIFVDFQKVPPMVLEDNALAFEARDIMKKEHVTLKIVVDANQHFKGILTLAHLTDENLGKAILSGGFEKDNLLIKECMVKKAELHSIDYEEMKDATIGDVIEALRHIGHRHCLVVDGSSHTIRGVITACEITRALHVTVDISKTGVGTSFYEMFQRLNRY